MLRVTAAVVAIGSAMSVEKSGNASGSGLDKDKLPLQPTPTLEMGGRKPGPVRPFTSEERASWSDHDNRFPEGVGTHGNGTPEPDLIEKLLKEARESVGNSR